MADLQECSRLRQCSLTNTPGIVSWPVSCRKHRTRTFYQRSAIDDLAGVSTPGLTIVEAIYDAAHRTTCSASSTGLHRRRSTVGECLRATFGRINNWR